MSNLKGYVIGVAGSGSLETDDGKVPFLEPFAKSVVQDGLEFSGVGYRQIVEQLPDNPKERQAMLSSIRSAAVGKARDAIVTVLGKSRALPVTIVAHSLGCPVTALALRELIAEGTDMSRISVVFAATPAATSTQHPIPQNGLIFPVGKGPEDFFSPGGFDMATSDKQVEAFDGTENNAAVLYAYKMLAGAGIPVAFIHDKLDALCPPGGAIEIAQRFPYPEILPGESDALINWTSGDGHVSLQEPSTVNKVMESVHLLQATNVIGGYEPDKSTPSTEPKRFNR